MIGIFDSGVGGLTVVREVFKQLPDYQIVYFGDTARTPYGNKSENLIKKYAIEDTNFLLGKGANLIIVACNTASAVASDELKAKYKNIPIFEVITPAVKRASEMTKNKRLGIIGTKATIHSQIYEHLIRKNNPEIKVFSKASPLLVPLVEEGWLKKPETKMILKKYLHPLKLKQIDTLILGCTHYPLLKEIIQAKMSKRTNLIDPAQETVKEVKKYLENNPAIEKTLQKGANHQFYFSDISPNLSQMAASWLGQKIEPDLINLG